MVHPEHREGGPDGVAGLHGDHPRDLPGLVDGHQVWNLGELRHFVISFLTIGSGDQLQVLAVVCHQPLDKVDLLESDLHCVLMLGPTRGVGHPKLRRWVEKNIREKVAKEPERRLSP